MPPRDPLAGGWILWGCSIRRWTQRKLTPPGRKSNPPAQGTKIELDVKKKKTGKIAPQLGILNFSKRYFPPTNPSPPFMLCVANYLCHLRRYCLFANEIFHGSLFDIVCSVFFRGGLAQNSNAFCLLCYTALRSRGPQSREEDIGGYITPTFYGGPRNGEASKCATQPLPYWGPEKRGGIERGCMTCLLGLLLSRDK